MSNLIIHDLEDDQELTKEEMLTVKGGMMNPRLPDDPVRVPPPDTETPWVVGPIQGFEWGM